MRSPFGRIGRFTLFLLGVVVALVVTGTIVPGRTGTVIQTVGWILLAVCIILKVGIHTTGIPNYEGDDRRPW